MTDALPALSGARNLATGSYRAEQRSDDSYDLFMSASHTNNSSEASPRKGNLANSPRRKAGQRFEAKCTILPALVPIDPLLAQAAKTTERQDDVSTPRLPEIVPTKSTAAVTASKSVRRLYPGRQRTEVFGDSDMVAPTDEEFIEWLTVGPMERVRSDSSSAKPKLARQLTMANSMGKTCSQFTHTPSLAHSSAASPSPHFLEMDESDEPGGTWHVLLLRTTFDDKWNTAERVANTLIKVLGEEEKRAAKRVKEAQRRLMAMVGEFSSRSEAFEKATTLRKAGMVVQVTSEAGLPGSSMGKTDSKKTHTNGAAVSKTYSDLFHSTCQGLDHHGPSKAPPLLMPQNNAKIKRSKTRGWRGEMSEVTMSVLSEDPVADFLEAETRRQKTDEKVEFDAELRRPNKDCVKVCVEAPIEVATSLTGEELAGKVDTGGNETEAGGVVQPKAGGSLWSVLPGLLLLDALAPKQKIPPVRKEACQMIRFFVFGNVGNENAKTQGEREKIFYEAIGTREQVRTLYLLWHKLDDDNSGRVDICEFRAFAESNMREKMESLIPAGSSDKVPANLPSFANITSPEDIPKFTARLCDKLAQLLLGKKSSFVIEDMMRLIWPCAQMADLKHMRAWCKEFSKATDRKRVNPPPILPKDDFEGLCSVFRYFDDDNSGEVMLEELVTKGLIYEDQAANYFRDWDKNGDGSLDLLEFCEMMCPCGYRAHPDAKVGLRADGSRVIYDPTLECWRLEEKE